MGYDGALYDESRRNKLLQPAVPKEKLDTLLKKGDWNSYRIRAENGHVQLWVNGTQTVDYREEDAAIPQTGLIGLQIHGDCKAIIRFRDIVLTPLP